MDTSDSFLYTYGCFDGECLEQFTCIDNEHDGETPRQNESQARLIRY